MGGGFGSYNTLNFYISGLGAGTSGGCGVSVRDGANAATTQDPISGSADTFDVDIWQHILIERDGDLLYVFVDASEKLEASVAQVEAVNPNGLMLGTRTDLDAARFVNALMAEAAKWDAALDATAIGKLAAGSPPNAIGTTPAWWIPMYEDATEKVAGLTVTDNSGGINADHPVVYPASFKPHWAMRQNKTIGTGVI